MSKSAGTMDPESLIEQLNECLPASSSAWGAVRPIFIVGLPRSGSTLLVQLLVSHLYLGYATNLVARFWNRPAFGVALNRILSKDPGAVPENDSRYGRTLGYEGHHEFGWFWARWFDYGDSHRIEPERWNAIDTHALRAELSAMERAWGRPLIFKNPPALSMQIGFFEQFLDEPLYIYLRRSELEVATSLWRLRLESPGGAESWFPPVLRTFGNWNAWALRSRWQGRSVQPGVRSRISSPESLLDGFGKWTMKALSEFRKRPCAT